MGGERSPGRQLTMDKLKIKLRQAITRYFFYFLNRLGSQTFSLPRTPFFTWTNPNTRCDSTIQPFNASTTLAPRSSCRVEAERRRTRKLCDSPLPTRKGSALNQPERGS